MAISLIALAAQLGKPLPQGFADLITNTSVFSRILNFIPTPGLVFPYGQVASLGSIGYRAINQDYPTGSYSVVNPEEERLSIFGGEVRTDHIMIETGTRMPGINNNVRANEIARRIRRAGLFYDNEVINGEGFTDPKAIAGLKYRLTGNQVIKAGDNGAALSLAMLDDALDAVWGPSSAKVIVCNRNAKRQIKTLVVAAASGAAVADVTGQVPVYEGAKIEEIDESGDPETAILPFTETMGSSNETASLYVVRPGSTTDRESLQGLILGSMVNRYSGLDFGTYVLDVIESYLGIGLFHPRAASRIQGILKA